MSIDVLQERIRKLKSPVIVDLSVKAEHIPAHLHPQHDLPAAYDAFCRALLRSLASKAAGVRFSFDRFALLGALDKLPGLMQEAVELGYYVLLDGPAILTPWAAETAADVLLGEGSTYPCHGLVLSPWIGSDAIKTFAPYCKRGKSVFFAVRTPNKSSSELQDLLTGSRLAHAAAADIVNRNGESILAKCGYSHVGVLTAGTNTAAVQGLRTKYNRMFLLIDGIDYPGGNAKICSYGFDRFGHGAAVCAGVSVTGAWLENETDGTDFAEQAEKSVERIKNNIFRYISIL